MTKHRNSRFEVEIGTCGADSVYQIRVSTLDQDGLATGAITWFLNANEHDSYLDLFALLSKRLGTRMPLNRMRLPARSFAAPYAALLTENLGTGMLYGYGDPAILQVAGDSTLDSNGGNDSWYYLATTSNDAPDAFPLLRSRNLHQWEPRGFLFPRGQTPAWAEIGEGVADYWAPEIHKVGNGFRAYFVARRKGTLVLCIGSAHASHPEGPWIPDPEPLLEGETIDPHLLVASNNETYLYWKEDNNGIWPELLNNLLHEHPDLIDLLFSRDEDRATVGLITALWPWIRERVPMQRFFMQQPLIEAVRARFGDFRNDLSQLAAGGQRTATTDSILEIIRRLRTPFYVQRMTPDGRGLQGEPQVVLENDQQWEAHVIEGMWVAALSNRFYMFYAGNDFSTDDYGIGLAVGDSPEGPFQKLPGPLLRSTEEWSAPGHPSVAKSPAGRNALFLHAFRPGAAGYKELRALLMLEFEIENGVPVWRR